jgi:translocation and assembly module TamB
MSIEHKAKNYVHRVIKTILWILVGLLGLIILAVSVLQVPAVQRSLVQKTLSSISEKTHSRVEVGSVNIFFTHSVVLHNIFIESRQRDTLLSIQTLAVDVNLLQLFSHVIELHTIRIDSLTTHITRMLPDSSFNFDFIIKALSADSTSVDTNVHASAKSNWKILLGKVNLNGIDGTYDDKVSGLNLRLQLGTLKASIDRFDLDKMQFHIDELSLANTSASVTQTKETLRTDKDKESKSTSVDPRIKSLSLAKIHFTYENIPARKRYSVDLGTSTLLAEKIDLPSHHIALKKFMLENTNISVVQQKSKENKKEKSDTTIVPWVINLGQLILDDNSMQYDIRGTAQTKGLDPNHLRLDGVTMRAENLSYSKNRMKADISHTSFREHSGFDLRELSGGFILDSLHAQLANFTVATATSRIHPNILLSYTSLSALRNFPGSVKMKAAIDDSHLAVSDLLYFLPVLPIKNTSKASIKISMQLSGLVSDFRVEKFRASAGNSTKIDLAGTICGLPNVKTAYYDMNLNFFSTSRKDIQALVADTLLPKNIVLPSSIKISGNFKGTAKKFSASSTIATSIGNVKVNLELNSGKESKLRQWKTDVNIEEFNVGSLLNDPETFGQVSLKAFAAGTGLSKDDMEAQLNINVEKAVVNGYPYHNLVINGKASPQMFEGRAEMQDSNIVFIFSGIVNMSKENPNYQFTFDLKGADLHRLNFTSDDIRVAGVITSDLTGKDINDINGNIGVRNVMIIKNGKRYVVDSLVYVSVNKEGQTHISFESSIFAGQFDGTIAPGDLPEVLKEHVAQYFTLHGEQRRKNLKAQDFTFHITLRDPAALTDIFIPGLHRLSTGTIEGRYKSEKKNLNVNIDIPMVDYNNFKIDSLTLDITSDADLLQATLKVRSIADTTLRITNLQFIGKAEHDSIDVSLQSTRSDGFTKMLLAGVFNSVPDGYKFQFNKDGIVFQNLPWDVPSDNELLFGNNGFSAHNILLRNAGQSISFQSAEEKNSRSKLKIEFNGFNLATISQVVERESGLLGGILTGNVVLQNQEKQMAFTSDLKIKDFSFGQKLIGDVALRANKQTENVYDVTMDITGNGNQIAMKGKYRSEVGGNTIDLICDFTKVNLASIEPFTFGNVQRLSGTMSGKLHIMGTMKKPSINGEINFASTAFNPAFLNSYLHLHNGKIKIDAQGIEFKSFDLVDTLGNTASLSGNLFTEDFLKYSFDFRAHTDKFLLLNKPASRDALYYGIIILNSDLSVTGDQSRPIVTMQAELDKGTNFTIALPESELAVEERRGTVRFADVNTHPNSILVRQNFRRDRNATETERSSISTIDLTSNISVNKDSKLRILIDPLAGDSLVIQGEATLSFTIDPSGKLTLTGRYEILKGSYQLSFGDFIKRDFAIANGSSLTWLGSPYEADVDISAIYTVKASVLDLIQDQLNGISQEERNKYKQEIPIQVYLMMKGKLLTPEIHFKLDLAPEQRGVLNGTVYAKLTELNGQESELDKQVFALLILGRFISESPLASASGNGELSDYARSSASQILSVQLNRLSERYIAGVNLHVGLASYQDYSSGNAEGRTQLQLALSKQLFDDRVTVQVGGNVDIEGRRSQENSLNNFAGDLKVLYKLTEDGRWQLQAFRQNTYEGAIDGDVTKTGAGVVFTIDFDKLFGITLKPVLDEKK